MSAPRPAHIWRCAAVLVQTGSLSSLLCNRAVSGRHQPFSPAEALSPPGAPRGPCRAGRVGPLLFCSNSVPAARSRFGGLRQREERREWGPGRQIAKTSGFFSCELGSVSDAVF